MMERMTMTDKTQGERKQNDEDFAPIEDTPETIARAPMRRPKKKAWDDLRACPMSSILFWRASLFAVWLVLSVPSTVLAAQDCTHWTDLAFWKVATPDDVARCLTAGADLDARDKGGFTSLHWAASEGKADMVTALLQAGADPDARNKFDWTPLHGAALVGKADVVTALLQVGADPKTRNKEGKRPIDFADEEGKLTGPAYRQLHDASFD